MRCEQVFHTTYRMTWKRIESSPRSGCVPSKGRARRLHPERHPWSSIVFPRQAAVEYLHNPPYFLPPSFPPQIATPSYYYAPFHCYPDGNLSWKAALEVDPSAVCVHANIYTGDKKVYERDGDEKLRGNYHQRMREMLKVSRAGGAVAA